MLFEIIDTENAGAMEHETLIVIHFIASTFGGFCKFVHSS